MATNIGILPFSPTKFKTYKKWPNFAEKNLRPGLTSAQMVKNAQSGHPRKDPPVSVKSFLKEVVGFVQIS